jgi:hypothetical protein
MLNYYNFVLERISNLLDLVASFMTFVDLKSPKSTIFQLCCNFRNSNRSSRQQSQDLGIHVGRDMPPLPPPPINGTGRHFDGMPGGLGAINKTYM